MRGQRLDPERSGAPCSAGSAASRGRRSGADGVNGRAGVWGAVWPRGRLSGRARAQDMVLFLQRLPTGGWGEKEVETVLSRAYMWRTSFAQAQSHLA